DGDVVAPEMRAAGRGADGVGDVVVADDEAGGVEVERLDGAEGLDVGREADGECAPNRVPGAYLVVGQGERHGVVVSQRVAEEVEGGEGRPTAPFSQATERPPVEGQRRVTDADPPCVEHAGRAGGIVEEHVACASGARARPAGRARTSPGAL